MPRKHYPEYHKALLDPASHPTATRKPRLEETPHSYIYRTGSYIYRIRKTSHIYSSLAVKERYALEAQRLLQRWAPGMHCAVMPIVRRDGSYALNGEEQGEVVDYALQLSQLSDAHWLQRLVPAGRFTATAAGRLARFLATRHAEAPAGEREAHDVTRPEHYHELLEEVLYQSKKYVGRTLTEPMLELIARPVQHFLEAERRLFLRRPRKGRVVDGHGQFEPRHIHMRGQEVLAVSPLEATVKFRVLDAANDVATLVMELRRLEADEMAEVFVKRYVSASKDRDLPRLLPAFEVLQAVRHGLACSERLSTLEAGDAHRASLEADAHTYYNLAVQAARQLRTV